jgi:general secretion pathway protein A
MYESYWKLREKPFENTPDPRFFYYSQRHEEALSRMYYAVRERKGAAVLTGECGSGKTVLSRVLLEELSAQQYDVALIFNPRLPSSELIREIIYQAAGNAPASTSKADLLHQLNDILYQNSGNRKNTVVVIDEAQALSEEDGLEEIRLLLNFQLNEQFLLTIILLGQPELKEKIDRLPQLRQRLAIRYHLRAFSANEVKEYIKHRLEVAGSGSSMFTDEALAEIYRFSGGVPRRINNICDLALLVGYSEGAGSIDAEAIREAALDLEEIPINKEEKAEVVSNG